MRRLYVLLGALLLASVLMALMVSSVGAQAPFGPSGRVAALTHTWKGGADHWVGYGSTRINARRHALDACDRQAYGASCEGIGDVRNGWIAYASNQAPSTQPRYGWGWGWDDTKSGAISNALYYCKQDSVDWADDLCKIRGAYETSRGPGQTTGSSW